MAGWRISRQMRPQPSLYLFAKLGIVTTGIIKEGRTGAWRVLLQRLQKDVLDP
jgi:hypothetical protein